MKREDKLYNRRVFLESIPEVKFYITFMKKSDAEKDYLINEYNLYIDESKKSKAKKILDMAVTCRKAGDDVRLKKIGLLARKMLANNDYQLPPSRFDLSTLWGGFFVSQYRNVMSEINKDNGFQDEVMNALS